MAFRLKTLHEITTHPLTQKAPFEAFKRYFLFHVSQILFHYPIVYPWVGSLKLLTHRGWAGVVGNIYTGLYDFEDMGFLLHYLKKDELFVDIGSNLGVYSLLAAGICQAKTMSFEPIPETFELLKAQIQLNRLEHLIEAHQVGLSEKSGELFFSTAFGTMNHVVSEYQEGESVKKVPIHTLDQLIQSPASILKIDTEGFELPVLKGGSQCLSKPELQAIIIELNDSGERYGYSDQAIDSLLKSYNFSPFQYCPFERQLKALNDWRRDQHNTLYLREPEKILPRVQSAPKLKILNQEI